MSINSQPRRQAQTIGLGVNVPTPAAVPPSPAVPLPSAGLQVPGKPARISRPSKGAPFVPPLAKPAKVAPIGKKKTTVPPRPANKKKARK